MQFSLLFISYLWRATFLLAIHHVNKQSIERRKGKKKKRCKIFNLLILSHFAFISYSCIVLHCTVGSHSDVICNREGIEKRGTKYNLLQDAALDPIILRWLHLHCTATKITFRILRSGCYILNQLRAAISMATFVAFAGVGDTSSGGDSGNLAEKLLRLSEL